MVGRKRTPRTSGISFFLLSLSVSVLSLSIHTNILIFLTGRGNQFVYKECPRNQRKFGTPRMLMIPRYEENKFWIIQHVIFFLFIEVFP